MARGNITFVVRGRKQVETTVDGHKVETVLVGGVRGEGEESTALNAELARDVVKMKLANGTELILNPETARELFRAQQAPVRGATARATGSEHSSEEDLELVEVPTRLAWPQAHVARGNEKGGEVLLRSFQLVKETVSSKGANLVGAAIGELVDASVNEGLYRVALADKLKLGKENMLAPGQPIALAGKKVLILVHGTFSSSEETFGNFWKSPPRVRALFNYFDGQVYAFEHATLTKSPIENALTLADHLPSGAEIYFLTHSRGGLVAEVLAQLVARPNLADLGSDVFDGQGYARQRHALIALRGKLAGKELHIRRVVRVACPTRGTLLASGRLDAYLSVLKWTFDLAGVPLAASFLSFLHEVAKRRAKPDEFPGLEAMMPERPFIRWLHRSDVPIDGEVRVVAGDVQGDTVVSWLKTLCSDAFYWTDNDFIVQTRSMYGGAPRKEDVLFYLDRSAAVSHFSYFSNQTTAGAIANALIAGGERPAQFALVGPQSSRGLDSSGIRGQKKQDAPIDSPALPAVFLLPGIMGTHLKIGDERVWLTWRMFNGLRRLEYVAEGGQVAPDGPLGSFYDDLIEDLRGGREPRYEVIPFGYDWRVPIEDEAKRLAERVTAALDARKASGQVVHILAHSVGGLVARALQFAAPAVWRRFMAQDNGRLVMLGTPNAGSWVPMQVLSGDHSLGGLLTSVGALFDACAARRIFAGLPGLLQLQANLERFATTAKWQELEQKDRQVWNQTVFWHNLEIQWQANAWGIPTQPVLDRAVALRKQLTDAQFDGETARKILLVVGSASSTPGPVRCDDAGIRYEKLSDGDGTVPLESALLPSITAYRCDAEHTELPRRKSLFAAYRDLLQHGSTTVLTRVVEKGASRGAPASAERGAATPPEQLPRAALRGFAPEVPDALEASFALSERDGTLDEPLAISVVNGNLTFINQALLMGHYRSQTLTGSEKVMDRMIGGTMSRALALDDYPQELGENKTFVNQHRALHDPFALPRPKSVLVVGMGDEGDLKGVALTRAITRAVVSYAQGLAQAPDQPAEGFELAATLLGSGGMGMTVATSAVSVAQGVSRANSKLRAWKNLPTVSRLHIIELYEDRAIEALRALSAAREQTPRAFTIESVLAKSDGGLPRPEDASYRGADYDMISATRPQREGRRAGAAPSEAASEESLTIEFTIDTKRARTESHATNNQRQLLHNLIRDAQSRPDSPSLGRTLFRVLVPRDLDAYFGNSERVLLEVDESTARIPWELLDTDGDRTQMPWAVRCHLLRKLKTQTYRNLPTPANRDAAVLVIGGPACDTSRYPFLPGAEAEAKAVAKLFGVEPLLNRDAATLVGALFDAPYRVVHIAGHGREDGAGVVMSENMVLNADLIDRLERVPDLVFVNCCHSAREELAVDPKAPRRKWDRPELAATIAGQLIRIGVRCVIATGWAVNDEAAEEFALAFYRGIERGERFVDAVSQARQHIWLKFSNSLTWAAYQCYGDPDWVLTEGVARRGPRTTAPDKESFAAPSVLLVALATLAQRAASADPEERRELLARLDMLAGKYEPRWGNQGRVAEAFALAYRDLGSRLEHLDRAITWYGRAVNAEDGGASQRAVEQLCNLVSRRAADHVAEAFNSERDDAKFADRVKSESSTICPTIDALKHLAAVHSANGGAQSTYERANLLGSAWKRLAMIWQLGELRNVAGASAEVDKAVKHVIESCEAAEKRGRALEVENLHYAQLTRMTAQLVHELRGGKVEKNQLDIESVRQSIERLDSSKPSFWTQSQRQELKVYEAVHERALNRVLKEVEGEFSKLYERLTWPSSWASVRDQARFLLRAYKPDDKRERDAAQRLLELLESYAWQS